MYVETVWIVLLCFSVRRNCGVWCVLWERINKSMIQNSFAFVPLFACCRNASLMKLQTAFARVISSLWWMCAKGCQTYLAFIHICPLLDAQLVSSVMRVRKKFSPYKDMFTRYDTFTIYNIRFKQVEMHGYTLKVIGRD